MTKYTDRLVQQRQKERECIAKLAALVQKTAIGEKLGAALASGDVSGIPLEWWTAENLLVANKNGWNGFHIAAENGHLDQIPKELLTMENLLVANKDGCNSFHMAAAHGHLDQIPVKFLTPENLDREMNDGRSFYNLIQGNKNSKQHFNELKRYGVLRQSPAVQAGLDAIKKALAVPGLPPKVETFLKKEQDLYEDRFGVLAKPRRGLMGVLADFLRQEVPLSGS